MPQIELFLPRGGDVEGFVCGDTFRQVEIWWSNPGGNRHIKRWGRSFDPDTKDVRIILEADGQKLELHFKRIGKLFMRRYTIEVNGLDAVAALYEFGPFDVYASMNGIPALLSSLPSPNQTVQSGGKHYFCEGYSTSDRRSSNHPNEYFSTRCELWLVSRPGHTELDLSYTWQDSKGEHREYGRIGNHGWSHLFSAGRGPIYTTISDGKNSLSIIFKPEHGLSKPPPGLDPSYLGFLDTGSQPATGEQAG